MRVILGHNYYRSSAPSGEDIVFQNEHRLLEQKGLEVITFERFNDDIDDSSVGKRIRIALESAWSRRIYEQLSDILRRTKPDLAHFHNTFPQISPSVYAACQDNNVPVVQTLHNYRFICPGAFLMREARPCEDCVGTSLLPALRNRCYRNSLTATGAVIWIIINGRWRGAYEKMVNRYIALTRFAASRMIAGGLPQNCVEVKPNFLPNPPSRGNGEGNYAVYVGRLSDEKGVSLLTDTWRHFPNLPLKIFGDGPLRKKLEERVKREGLSIEFLGYSGQEEIFSSVRDAMFQVVPSVWYEGLPMVILEAYACGTPVIVSRIGSLAEIVVDGETGVHFTPGDANDLAEKINDLRKDMPKLATMRQKSRALFEEKYTAEKNFSKLLEIYERTIEDFKVGKKR